MLIVTPAGRWQGAITRLITGIESKGSFATCFPARADGLQLKLDGAGQVPLPVTAAMVSKPRTVAQPAHYGLRDQTLLDPAIRDTGEIPGSRISTRRKAGLEAAPDSAAALGRLPLSFALSCHIAQINASI